MSAAARWAALDGDETDTPPISFYGLDHYFSEPDVPEMNVGLALQLHWPAVPAYCEERRPLLTFVPRWPESDPRRRPGGWTC